jgi:hypothetical protein
VYGCGRPIAPFVWVNSWVAQSSLPHLLTVTPGSLPTNRVPHPPGVPTPTPRPCRSLILLSHVIHMHHVEHILERVEGTMRNPVKTEPNGKIKFADTLTQSRTYWYTIFFIALTSVASHGNDPVSDTIRCIKRGDYGGAAGAFTAILLLYFVIALVRYGWARVTHRRKL